MGVGVAQDKDNWYGRKCGTGLGQHVLEEVRHRIKTAGMGGSVARMGGSVAQVADNEYGRK